MNLIMEFITNILLSFSEVIAWSNISYKHLNFKSKKIYIYGLILSTLTFIISTFLNNFLNSIGIIFISISFCHFIIKENWKNSIILAFIGELLAIISEAIIVIIMTLILKVNLNDVPIYTYIINVLVSGMIITLSKINIFSKMYIYIKKITYNSKVGQTFLFIIFTTFGICFSFASTYFKINLQLMILINICIAIFYSLMVLFILKYQNKYNVVNSKYSLSLECLQVQEKLINEYRVVNHENKNQLMTIKTMTKNKKIINYINSLLNQKNNYFNQILNNAIKLPDSGIRALIYNKIVHMKNNGIDCDLNIDKSITNKLLLNLKNEDVVDICQILGVFIDNAIDETKYLDTKIILIDFHQSKNKLYITISNNYQSKLNINKNTNIIKSSKGANHGYGLQLVSKIISHNKKLSNERIITKDNFSQKLIVLLDK